MLKNTTDKERVMLKKINLKDKLKLSKKSIVMVAAVTVAVIIMIVMIVCLTTNASSKKSQPEVITKSTLQKIIDVNDLSTFEAVYNGIAKVMNKEKTEEVDYHVSYEAKVKAGIDFKEVTIEIDNELKIITITIPDVRITDIAVDITTLDFLFENEKANTESVSEEAYKACIEDVKQESNSEDAIYELAEQNARNIIEALIKPFVSQLDEEYTLEIK